MPIDRNRARKVGGGHLNEQCSEGARTVKMQEAKWGAAYRDHDRLTGDRRARERERRIAFAAELEAELDAIYAVPIAEAAERLKAAEQAYDAAVEAWKAEALAKPR